MNVLNRYQRLSGVPRSAIPNIGELDAEQTSRLEEAITKDRRLFLEKAKRIAIRYSAKGNHIPPV